MSTQPDWHEGFFDFFKYGEGVDCRVKTANGDEYIAACFKHYPASGVPAFNDDWITNDSRCEDKKNGRVKVVAWLPPDPKESGNPSTNRKDA